MTNEIIRFNLSVINEKVNQAKIKYDAVLTQKGFEILCLIDNCIVAIDGSPISIENYNDIENLCHKVLTKKYTLKKYYMLKGDNLRLPSCYLKHNYNKNK